MEATHPDQVTAQRDQFVEKMFAASLGMMDILTVYLGDRLGLYQALADVGPATPADLASRAGIHERYAREWLEQQAVAGILEADEQTEEAAARRFSLPVGHSEALLDRDSIGYIAPLARQMLGVTHPVPALMEAFRTGAGVPYTEYGEDMREGIAEANRALFVNLMGTEWLPGIPDVHRRLHAQPPARVADIGCGSGWSSISIARAYSAVRVDGFDVDESSIRAAAANAEREGLTDRVSFHVRDAASSELAGQYDLAIAIECIHDMAQPVQALRAMRRMVGDSGTVLVVDERVGEHFSTAVDEVECLYYGFSVLHCLPVGMAEQPSAGTGTVMRPDTLRQYAHAAGYRTVEVLPIENDMWRFYRLLP